MLNAWKKMNIELKIIGDGPLKPLVLNQPNIKYLGFMNQKQIYKEMQKAAFLIFPSIWGETFGMVIIESFANGLPVIASNIGSPSEIIKDGYNGLHFNVGDSNDLIKKINLLNSDKNKCNKLGSNAIIDYKSKYTKLKNYELLIKIYKKAINAKNTKNT